MKFALAFANIGPAANPDGAIAFAREAEAAGIESLWTVEHVVVPAGYQSQYPYSETGRMPGPENSPIPDPLVWLAFIASATNSLRLGTGVMILPQRNPVVLAKEVATLDHLSGGRVELGVGVGWLAEEFAAIGVPFGERGARTDDAIAALRALWSEEEATYHGRYSDFEHCIVSPKPPHGRVPIHVGGHSEIAARRAGRLGAGFVPASGSHEGLAHLFDVMRETARAHGRDPDAIELTTGGNGAIGSRALDEVKALADLGVARVVLPAFLFFQDPHAALGRYYDEVISHAS